ncbi:hypothetical protein [Rufibacter roseus]|uniref:Lipoprotein n=1 Tax=Rufibacter roseus TaxID=1567108 RepID=A0ABW2DS81_9BACT|nr:hypothetical protein [Rufibacter roseus]
MKRILYLSYSALLVPLLSSCQIGGMDNSSVTAMVLPYESRIASCDSHSYTTKDAETIDLGTARGDVILVGFKPNLTLEERQQIIRLFPFTNEIDGEVTMDSGIITRVKLISDATCFEAWKTLKELEKHESVLFANPAFNPTPQDAGTYQWIGLTNEFIVALEEGTSQEQFNALLKETNAAVVFSLSDEMHVVSADKNSTGNALELTTLFNSKAFVAGAEPNFIYFLNPIDVETSTQRASFKKLKKN